MNMDQNEKPPRHPQTARNQAEYEALVEENKRWVEKHGHRMLDEPGDWRLEDPQEESD